MAGEPTPPAPPAPPEPPAPPTPPAPPADWFDGLAPELKADKSLASFKGKPVGELAKSFVSAQQMVGGSIRLPKADAKPEERQAAIRDLQTKLGLPEAPDKYQVQAPQGAKLDDGLMKSFLPVAHKLGLLPEQVNALVAWNVEQGQAMERARAEALQKAEQTLRQEWGGAYDRKLALVQRVAKDIGGDEFVQEMELTGKGNSVALMRFLDRVAEVMAEHGSISGEVQGQTGPNEAADVIKAAEADPKHEFWSWPLEKRSTYYKLAYGTKPVAV